MGKESNDPACANNAPSAAKTNSLVIEMRFCPRRDLRAGPARLKPGWVERKVRYLLSHKQCAVACARAAKE